MITMTEKTTCMTEFDVDRLEAFLEGIKKNYRYDRNILENLQEEIGKCQIVQSHQVPANVVTLNSRVRLRDLDADQEMVLTLALPGAANFEEGRISVASPVGTAILGYAAGDTIEWNVPSGTKRIRIEEILYQPEAAGDYHL